jgi:wobble nucleotide-excising tRNase
MKTEISDNRRIAKIKPLDTLLRKYNSEYHYLFSLVYNAANRRNCVLEDYYPIPNVCRRLLESFLAFKIPSIISNLPQQINATRISEERKTRIIRYTNANSHGDHIRDVAESDLSFLEETSEVLKDILELIEIEDERHYREMERIIQAQS